MRKDMIYAVLLVIVFAFLILYFNQYIGWPNKRRGVRRHVRYLSEGMLAEYSYFIPHAQERTMEILSHKNVKDKLCYDINQEDGEIIFSNPENEFYRSKGTGLKYQMEFISHKDGCILRLRQKQRIVPRDASVVPWMLDEFWEVKTGAVPYNGAEYKEE